MSAGRWGRKDEVDCQKALQEVTYFSIEKMRNGSLYISLRKSHQHLKFVS